MLWLGDSASCILLAAVFGLIAAKPAAATKWVIVLLALVPVAFVVTAALKGGIAEWLSANLPTETKEAPKQATPEPGALKG